jgi:hypothetical protein
MGSQGEGNGPSPRCQAGGDNEGPGMEDEGKGIPHDKVKEEFAEWLTK